MTSFRHFDAPGRFSFYDAFLILSYGGPEREADIAPFLDRLLSGKDVPTSSRRCAEEKYRRSGGSPLGKECRHFAQRLRWRMTEAGIVSPPTVYLANLYSPPLLEEIVREITENGHRTILVMTASPFGSPQSCRRYRDRLNAAVTTIGGITAETAPNAKMETKTTDEVTQTTVRVVKEDFLHDFQEKNQVNLSAPPRFYFMPPYFAHPRFIKAQSDLILALLAEDELTHGNWGTDRSAISTEEPPAVLFSAHSLPLADAETASYESQLLWVGERVADAAALGERIRFSSTNFDDENRKIETKPALESKKETKNRPVWNLVYQSRSGRPGSPWTGPGIEEFIRDDQVAYPKRRRYLILPVGFFFENMETVVDLDVLLTPLAEERNLDIWRTSTVARSPEMVEMVLDFLATPPCFVRCGSPAGKCLLSCQVRPFEKREEFFMEQ